MIYVLTYPIFAPDIAARIRAFRAKHEPDRAKLVPPHITLVFGVADRHLHRLSRLVDTVAGQTGAVSVLFERQVIEFDPFEAKHKLFLLCGEGRTRIEEMHHALYDGAHRAALSQDHPFSPHMTLASYDERANVVRSDVSEVGALPIKATLSGLVLVRVEEGVLTTLKTAPFTA